MSVHSVSSSADGAAEIPAFVQRMTEWLQDENNTKHIETLKRESTIAQLKIRKQEVKILNDLQASTRPKLRDIPGFWPFALVRHKGFAEVCNTRDDLDALGYLADLELKINAADPRAFDLIFTFSENPYFEDKTLVKSFVLDDQVTATQAASKAPPKDEYSDEALGFLESDLTTLKTDIKWKAGQNLCERYPRVMEDDAEDDGDWQGDRGSFFHFFPETEDTQGLGPSLASDIIPHCIDYFLGLGDECDSDDELDSDSEEEDEIEPDEEIDLESEDVRPAKRAKRAKMA